MAIYYSKSTGGFYIDGVNTTMPSDKVAVSQNAWQHLISNQGSTSQIASDANGNPILVDPTNSNAVVYTSVGVS